MLVKGATDNKKYQWPNLREPVSVKVPREIYILIPMANCTARNSREIKLIVTSVPHV